MSIEIDEDPKVVMLIPPELLTSCRRVGRNMTHLYGVTITQTVITNYESYLLYRVVRQKVIAEQKYFERIWKG